MTLRRYILLAQFLIVSTFGTQAAKPFEKELREVELAINDLNNKVNQLDTLMTRIGLPRANWDKDYANLDRYTRYHDVKNFQSLLNVQLKYLKAHQRNLQRTQDSLVKLHESKEKDLQNLQAIVAQIILDQTAAENRELDNFNMRMQGIDNDRKRLLGEM